MKRAFDKYMIRYIMVLLLFMLQSTVLPAQTASETGNLKVKVEGTEMARLPYILDILKQTPTISVTGNTVNVIGRGIPAIYIGNRKVTDLTELSHIAASYVSSITVMTQPGVEYGKDVQAVIVIEPIEDYDNGLLGEGTLRFDLTNKLASNAEMTLGWKRDALHIGTFMAYNEEFQKYSKVTFHYHYKDQNLVDKEENVETPDKYSQRWKGAVFGSYAFNDKNRLFMQYTLMNLRINRTYTPETSKTDRKPETRHSINLEYTGTLGAWQLSAGNNTFFYNIEENGYKTKSFSYYLREQSDSRTYALAKTAMGKGKLSLGAEYEYDFMELSKYEDAYDVDDRDEKPFKVHARHPDHTAALYASASQQFGNWTIEGGLRYEHRSTTYQPCSDDGLMMTIDDSYKEYEAANPNSIMNVLYKSRELHKKRDFLFPSLKITTKQGKSQFTLLHTQSSIKPNLGLTRLATKDLEYLDQRILKTERVATTSLNWKYSWLNLTAMYTHFTEPICSTIDGSVSYTAPDYDAFDFNTTLSPRIGVWSPVLNVNIHKQWFYMELANGKDKLYKILCRVSLDNTISLPSNWLILANANWHSKGGERNWYFYKPDFCLNASVQKEFPRQRLTLVLSAQNIFNDSYLDITRYTKAYNNISQGAREENIRSVSLTAKWKL